MIKLMKFMKGSIVFAILAPLMMLIEVSMDLQLPNLMSSIVDVGVANQDINFIWSTGKVMLVFACFGMIGGLGTIIFSSIAALGFGTRLRQATFDKIQDLSFREIDQLKTSSLITRITNDITQVQNLVMLSLRMMARAPMLVIGGIIMAGSISFELSIIFFVAIPTLILAIFIIVKSVFKKFMEIQQKTDRVNMVMRENLLGVKVIKAFLGRNREIERFKVANEDLMNKTISAQKIIILMFPIVDVIMYGSIVALMWFGGNMVVVGSLEVGQIMAFMNYLMQILMSLTMIIMFVMNYSRASASAQRINEIHDTVSSLSVPKNAQMPSDFGIEFENVSFCYNEGLNVLEDISFKISHGEKVGIIGGTGSGKSTVAALVPRLYDVTKGSIKIGGVNVKDINGKYLVDNISLVMQESVLLSGTVKENICFGNSEATQDDIKRALKNSGSLEFVENLENGIESKVSQRGKNYSGGQKQRLSIARALAKNPQVLILDDSTSAVDTKTEKMIQAAIGSYNITSIVIAQRISSIAHLDKIIVLEEGRVTGIGTHKELIKSNETYRLIAKSQLGEEAIVNG